MTQITGIIINQHPVMSEFKDSELH